jgi:hypothetical protein
VQALMVLFLVSALSAQLPETRPQIGVPEDWTHHRIKFSTAVLREHPEMAAHEPRAAMQLYRDAFQRMRAAMANSLTAPQQVSASTFQTHSDWSIGLGGATVQFGAFPAKWNIDPTAAPSCAGDFVIFALNEPGVTLGQPSIVGLNRLYSDGADPLCPGFAQPHFLFSYNTTTTPNGKIMTSPILSLDGKKVAFIETVNATGPKVSILHVLKIPTPISSTLPGQDLAIPSHNPPGGAMANLTLGAASNTRSSPWIDYKSDTIYVGLDDGKLYKVTGVFKGTPTLAGAPFPLTINLNSTLGSPMLDIVSGKLFIGAGNGRLYSVNVNSPAGVTFIEVGRTGSPNPDIYDAPMFDATGGSIFAVTSNDNVSNDSTVVQVNTTTFAVTTRVAIGQGSTFGQMINLYDGDFDNAYFNNPATGHLMVCGTGAASPTPYRYRLGFNASGVLQPATGVQISTNGNGRCSPITEFFNPNIGGGTDFFFWGVTRCNSGNSCVMALANGTTLSQLAVPGTQGTSGIIIDNTYVNPTFTGGSSIYFANQNGNSSSAFKATQQGLQ